MSLRGCLCLASARGGALTTFSLRRLEDNTTTVPTLSVDLFDHRQSCLRPVDLLLGLGGELGVEEQQAE